MAIETIVDAIRIFQPAAKVIPVAGPWLDGLLGAVLELYKLVERVKTNHAKMMQLLERQALLSYTISKQLEMMPPDQRQDMQQHVQDVVNVLDQTKSFVTTATAATQFGRFALMSKRASNTTKELDEIIKLDKQVDAAVERFHIATSMRQALENANASAARENGAVNTALVVCPSDYVAEKLFSMLKPEMQSLFSAHKAPSGCLPGTRKDLLQVLVSWALSDDSQRVFWLSGLAGTGKSTVAKSVCNLIDEHIRAPGSGVESDVDPQMRLLSFFISRDSTERRDPFRILHTLLYYFTTALADFRVALYKVLVDRPDILAQPINDQVQQLLTEPLNQLQLASSIIIVIDAFDECDRINDREGGDLLPALLSFIRHSSIPIRLLLTSRHEQSIEDMFALCRAERSLRLHEIALSVVEKDIRTYLQHELVGVSENDVNALVARANGLFIYAATVVRFVKLNDYFDSNELLQTVLMPSAVSSEAGPAANYATLDEMYTCVLLGALPSGTSQQNADASAKIIRMIVVSLALLQDQVSIPALASLTRLNVAAVGKVIKRLYSVLVVDDSGIIRLFHASFADFVLDSARCKDDFFSMTRPGHLSIAEYHSHLAHGCLGILNSSLRENMGGMTYPGSLNDTVGDHTIALIFPGHFAYACAHWVTHLVLAGADGLMSLRGSLASFCSVHLLHWVEAMSLLKKIRSARGSIAHILHWLHLQTILPPLETVLMLLRDLLRLMEIYSTPITSACLQVYVIVATLIPSCPLLDATTGSIGVGYRAIQMVRTRPSRWSPLVHYISRQSIGVHSLVTSQSGARIISGGVGPRETLFDVWDVTTGECVAELSSVGHGLIDCLACSPNGDSVAAAGSQGNRLHLFDLTSPTPKASSPVPLLGTVLAMQYSSDASKLTVVCAKKSGRVQPATSIGRIYDFDLVHNTLRDVEFPTTFSAATCGAISTTGSHFVLVGSLDRVYWSERMLAVYVWCTRSLQVVATFPGHYAHVSTVAISFDSSLIATGSADRTIKVWSMHSQSEVCTLRGHTAEVTSTAFSSDGTYLASAACDGTVQIWSTLSFACTATLSHPSEEVNALAFLSQPYTNDVRLVSGTGDDSLRVWAVGSNAHSGTDQTEQDHTRAVESVSFANNATVAATAAHDAIRIWHTGTGECTAVLPRPPTMKPFEHFHTVELSADGSHLSALDSSDRIAIWGLESLQWELIKHYEPPSCCKGWTHRRVTQRFRYGLQFSADGTTIVSTTCCPNGAEERVVTKSDPIGAAPSESSGDAEEAQGPSVEIESTGSDRPRDVTTSGSDNGNDDRDPATGYEQASDASDSATVAEAGPADSENTQQSVNDHDSGYAAIEHGPPPSGLEDDVDAANADERVAPCSEAVAGVDSADGYEDCTAVNSNGGDSPGTAAPTTSSDNRDDDHRPTGSASDPGETEEEEGDSDDAAITYSPETMEIPSNDKAQPPKTLSALGKIRIEDAYDTYASGSLSYQHSPPLRILAVAQKGRMLAARAGEKLCVWALPTRLCVPRIDGDAASEISWAEFSSDGQTLYCGNFQNQAAVFDLTTVQLPPQNGPEGSPASPNPEGLLSSLPAQSDPQASIDLPAFTTSAAEIAEAAPSTLPATFGWDSNGWLFFTRAGSRQRYRMLWLPPDRRPLGYTPDTHANRAAAIPVHTYDWSGNTAVIGSIDGTITILRVDCSLLPMDAATQTDGHVSPALRHSTAGTYSQQPVAQLTEVATTPVQLRVPSPLPVVPMERPAASTASAGSIVSADEGVLFYVEACYDYQATVDEEFDFEAGDVIAVTSAPDNGWWSGWLLDETRRVPGRHVFPYNFVREFR